MAEEEKAAEYHSKDFEWEDLRRQVEEDPSLLYHLSPSDSPPLPSSAVADDDADSWRRFHRRHAAGKFFKERRYLLNEFPELVNCADNSKVLEVGCGNGSTVLPILRTCQTTYALKPECSPDPKEGNLRMLDGPSLLKQGQCCLAGMDFVTLIFTLSAIPYHKMSSAIQKCFSILKPGGLLLFRDYGLYDMTMLRFLPQQKMGFREYMRSDGTFSYFFSLDIARDLFCGAGFTVLELEYCCVSLINRRNGKTMKRVWIHGKFQKPM